MNNPSILKQLKKVFPQFDWTFDKKFGSHFGNINVPMISKRINKDLYRFGNIQVYISSEMYPGKDKSFFYAMCYQRASIREYRRKSFYEAETNKTFVSGKTLNDILDNLVAEVNMNIFRK